MGYLQSRFLQHIQCRLQQIGPRAFQQNIAACHGHRHGISARFDPVGQYFVMRATQPADTGDFDTALAGATDFRPHFIEAQGQIDHFGLTSGIFDDRIAIGQTGRHQRRMRAANRHFRKTDQPALQAFRGARHHITAVNVDFGAQRFQRHDQQIHRTGADGAAAGQGHTGLTHPRQKRCNDPEAGPHARHQLRRGGGIDDITGGQRNAVALPLALINALAADSRIHPVIADNPHQQADIRQARNIVQCECFPRQQAGNHQGQSRIFSPADHNGAMQRLAADNPDTIHC